MSETRMPSRPVSSAGADPKIGGRIDAIDFFRFVALIAMAIYHFAWDLQFFNYLPMGTTTQGGWLIFARCIATSFLFLVGVSLVLAHRRGIRWRPFGVRLAQILAGAGAITLVTYFVTPNEFVYFGILHHIAVASVIGLAFIRLPWWVTALTAVVVLVLPGFVAIPALDPKWLNWIGLFASPPQTSDFVPLFPFMAADLAGIAAANLALKADLFSRLRRFNPFFERAWMRPTIVLGRHALAFYLLHQPILFGLVFVYAQAFPADQSAVFARDCAQTCTQAGDAAFCQRYCACAEDELKSADLFAPLMRGGLSEADQSRIGEITAICARRGRVEDFE